MVPLSIHSWAQGLNNTKSLRTPAKLKRPVDRAGTLPLPEGVSHTAPHWGLPAGTWETVGTEALEVGADTCRLCVKLCVLNFWRDLIGKKTAEDLDWDPSWGSWEDREGLQGGHPAFVRGWSWPWRRPPEVITTRAVRIPVPRNRQVSIRFLN